MNKELTDVVRTLKLRGLDDETIVATLEQTWPVADISMVLDSLKYMQVPTDTQSGADTSNAYAQIKGVILERRKYAQYGLAIAFMAIVLVTLPKGPKAVVSTLVLLSFIWLILVGMLLVNTSNLPNPKSSYRKVNKVLYRDLATVGLIICLLSLVSGLIHSSDPLLGYAPTDPSRGSLFIKVIVSVAAAFFFYHSIKSANAVEAYYKTATNKPDQA